MNKSIENTFSPENERKEFSKRLIIALENCGLPSSPTVFCKLLQNNNSNLDLVKYALMGGQDYEYNFHLFILNRKI